MKRYRLALFDFDGTTFDSKTVAYLAMRYTFEFFGVRIVPTYEQFMSDIDPGLDFYYRYGVSRSVHPEELNSAFNEGYRINQDSLSPYEGAEQLLRFCHSNGMAVGIVSGNTATNIRLGLERARFGKLVHAMALANGKTTKTEAILRMSAFFRIPPDRAFYVDDTTSGLLAAKEAGATAIAVTHGFHGERVRSVNPDFVANHLDEVTDFLRRRT